MPRGRNAPPPPPLPHSESSPPVIEVEMIPPPGPFIEMEIEEEIELTPEPVQALATDPSAVNNQSHQAMTTALIHTGISHAKDGRLQQAVTAIKERHRASHSAALKCKCYHEILDLFEARYTTEDDEWFTPLAGVYLADLPQIIEDAKQHKVPPAEIDDTIFRARRAFYTSRLRVLIPQVLEWDPVNRQETFRKVQYGFKTGEEDSVIEYVNQSLGRLGGIKSTSEHLLRELPDKLVLAKSREEQVKIVGEAFFADEKGEVPESLLKYITMLQEGKTLDLVVLDMMTEYHDVWFKARDSWKLKQRLDYLYRAEVAHYADMERKAELDRQAALLESLPDYVWEVPPCVVCGKELRDRRFHTCSICSVFAINELQPLYTRVYCSLECHSVDVVTHRFTHHCSAGTKCLTRIPTPAPPVSEAGPATKAVPATKNISATKASLVIKVVPKVHHATERKPTNLPPKMEEKIRKALLRMNAKLRAEHLKSFHLKSSSASSPPVSSKQSPLRSSPKPQPSRPLPAPEQQKPETPKKRKRQNGDEPPAQPTRVSPRQHFRPAVQKKVAAPRRPPVNRGSPLTLPSITVSLLPPSPKSTHSKLAPSKPNSSTQSSSKAALLKPPSSKRTASKPASSKPAASEAASSQPTTSLKPPSAKPAPVNTSAKPAPVKASSSNPASSGHAAPAPSAESSPLSTLSSMSTPSSFSPPPPESSDHRFCIECINVLKRPTVWCTLKCAMKNFVQHRKDVHLPARQKMDTQGVIPADGGFMDKHEVYNQEDIEGLTITIEQGAKQWYDKFLQEVEITDPLLPGDKTFWM